MNLERQFQFLDALPEGLFEPVVTSRHGMLQQRVEGILQWRVALLGGSLPTLSSLQWPAPEVAEVLLKRLDALQLVPLCRDEESLTDHLLKDICTAADSVDRWAAAGLEGQFEDPLERRRPAPPQQLPASQVDSSRRAQPDRMLQRLDQQMQQQWQQIDQAMRGMGRRLGSLQWHPGKQRLA